MLTHCLGLTLTSVLMPCGAVGDDRFWLVRNGQPAATLVVPENPLQVVQSAAEELQYHLKLISGAELPIVTNRADLTGNLVRFGAEAARTAGLDYGTNPNAWVGSLQDHCLFLAGDDSVGPVMMTAIIHNHVRRGTLFAVYDFLETQLGVRWLWPGDLGTMAPRSQNISLKAYERSGKPALYFTRFRDGVGEKGIVNPGGWSSSLAAHQFHQEKVKWLLRHRFAMPLGMSGRHSYTKWWELYGETHPEYFNLLPDGTRRSDPFYCDGKGQYVSMCVSNPDLHRKIVEEWLRTRRPAEPFISAGENDTCGKCTCPRCMAWDVSDPSLPFPWEERLERARAAFEAGEANWYECLGSLSDRYARFYQSVLEEARRHDPKVKVMALAYMNYVKQPLKVKLSSDVVFFVTVPQDYPFTEAERQANRDDWQAWSKAGASLILRPNYMLEGAAMPLNLAKQRGEDFKFFAENNMIGNDFDSLMGQFGTMGLTLYTTARLNDQPSLSLATIFEEYYAAFGPAADAVRAYFDYLAVIVDHPPNPKLEGSWWAYGRFGYKQFTPEVLAHARDLLKRAEQAAQSDDLAGRRVAYLEKGLRHSELTAAMQQAFEAHKTGAADMADVRTAIADLVRFRFETEGEFVGDYGRLYNWETRFWNIPSLLKGIPEDKWRPATNQVDAALSKPLAEACGQHLVIRLAQETAIERIAFRNREALVGCKDFKVSFSQDGVTFREVLSGRLQTAESADPAQIFTLPTPQAARQVRLDVLSGYGNDFWSLRDIEFWTQATGGSPTRNVASEAELAGWTSDYGCNAYFENAARLILDGNPETSWVSAPLPLARLSIEP